MAKTRSPLHSVAASGTYGETITFTTARGPLATIKRHSTKRPPPTPAQITVRNAMALITAALRWISRTAFYNQTTGQQPRADWLAIAPLAYEWQNHFQRTALGINMLTYTAARTAWDTLDAPDKAAYGAEAETLAPPIKPRDQRNAQGDYTDHASPAEILYLIEYAAYAAGIRNTHPDTGPTNYASTPPAPGGTIWDGGATTWDGGATTWD